MSGVSAPYPVRFAQLAALWAYSVSQPVFSLLEGNPEFLVVRGSTRAEVVIFALVLALAPPAAAVALERAVSLASPIVGAALHLVFIGLFATPLALVLLAAIDPHAAAAVGGALVASVTVVAVYLRWRHVRLFLALSAVLPLLGLLSFVFGTRLVTEDAEGAHVRVAKKTPIVVIVFDELPVSSLMTSAGQLDAARYPNFGRLATSATWYPRATTVHTGTTGALPAIVTGTLPEDGKLPILADYPQNLFTLLGESYRMRVHEEVTYLCPKRYCPRPREPFRKRLAGLFGDARVAFLHSILPRSLAEGLPDISDRWSGFRNTNRLLAVDDPSDVGQVVVNRSQSIPALVAVFQSGFQAGESADTLHFMHFAALPHSPWRYLPAGREYPNADGISGRDGERWSNDPWLVQLGQQRYLLQLGYTDRVLGQLLDRLERTRLYDRALVVLLADHGVSFEAGGSRRLVHSGNIADIARIPLFVKLPGQTKGRVDPRPVRTVDIVPTIADALEVRVPWRTDGRSLLEPGPTPATVTVLQHDGTVVRASADEVDRAQARMLRRNRARFGEGHDSLFHIGVHRELLGRSLAGMRVRPSSSARVHFDDEALFRDVRASSPIVPARITGTIEGVEIAPEVELAVVVNGRIAALTRSFRVRGEQRFDTMVPESVFREGFNTVELLSIGGSRAMPLLTRLGGT